MPKSVVTFSLIGGMLANLEGWGNVLIGGHSEVYSLKEKNLKISY